jgi:hypothetical protein
MVTYTFPGGTGRVFMTTDDVPLNKEMVLNMDEWLRENSDVHNPVVTAAIPLEQIDD